MASTWVYLAGAQLADGAVKGRQPPSPVNAPVMHDSVGA